MRKRSVVVVILAAGALASASCKKLDTGAREHFATKFSCPEDRVEVKERPDVKWGQHTRPAGPAEQPPDEVRNDPGRLAKWTEDQANSGEAKLRAHLDSLDVFEVRGCGHEALMSCKHPTNQRGTTMSSVMCTEGPMQPVSAPR